MRAAYAAFAERELPRLKEARCAREAREMRPRFVGERVRQWMWRIFSANSSAIFSQENPNLKASQYTERLSKLWAKSPDNPMNGA